LSPRNAPAAAATITNPTLRSPAAATTPAVITTVSLGTTGKNASRKAMKSTIAYAHPDASETSWVKWWNTFVRFSAKLHDRAVG
jgi:hypothetical protein